MSSADAFFRYSNMAGGFGISRIFVFYVFHCLIKITKYEENVFLLYMKILHVSIPLPLLQDLTSCSNVINYFFESFLR